MQKEYLKKLILEQNFILSKKFKTEVVDAFIDSYAAGETPIPCVQCNQTVKFRDLFKYAKDLKADALSYWTLCF